VSFPLPRRSLAVMAEIGDEGEYSEAIVNGFIFGECEA
jgi:hypothetical protein